ncbi:MAG: hypothetical protein JWN48_3996 [Myxococcaceae bacterium]|nr:hypothetical protein [Myxococcaceae bacterium]
MRIDGARDLRIAAFTGPVGAALERSDLELLTRARPGLVLYLGGLGDSEKIARQNLTSLGALHVPTLFVAGGADRLAVVEAAFAALGEGERDTLFHASGLRELRVGSDRFVIVPGAPLGRYALDAESCGLTTDDLEQLQDEAQQSGASLGKTRTWLLSWQAPAGAGVAEGFGQTELGSPELQALGTALGSVGGLFAYPEAGPTPAQPLTVWVVPRLSRVGSLRADGSRLHAQVVSLVLSAKGLIPSP